jgi:hypothetical protein
MLPETGPSLLAEEYLRLGSANPQLCIIYYDAVIYKSTVVLHISAANRINKNFPLAMSLQ